MAYDEKLAARIRKTLSRKKEITEKHMFGGLCFLLNGNICCGVHKESLVLRIGPEAMLSASKTANVKPFDITGRPMKGWVMVGSKGCRTEEELKNWINQEVKFVLTLPEK